MTIVKHNVALNGFNQWTINGEAFSMDTMKPTYTLREGRRYRLKFRNASDDIHPLHLHRHSFELTRIGGKPTAGVIKDVVMLGEFQELEFDFIADNPQKDSPVAILNAGGMNDGVQQKPLHIDEKMPLLALDQFARVEPMRIDAGPPVSFSCRLMRSRRGYRWMGARSPPGRLSP